MSSENKSESMSKTESESESKEATAKRRRIAACRKCEQRDFTWNPNYIMIQIYIRLSFKSTSYRNKRKRKQLRKVGESLRAS